MHGRKWKTIADEMDRTPINIRDKYKSMGEESHELRQKDYWTVKELIMLIRFIEKRLKTPLLDPKITEEFLMEKIAQKKEDILFVDVSRKRKLSSGFDKKMVIFFNKKKSL